MQATDIDFVIIGAAKCATTWLQKALQSDPAVAMPDPELHYFSQYHDRGDAWYFGQFPEGSEARLVGEKSNSYLHTPGAAAKLHALLPHAKVVVQLRNPVERAYSDYCMLYRRGEVGADIANYLDPDRASNRRFIDDGLYHHQLKPYLSRYPRENILVLLYDDMVRSGQAQLDRVRSFLGLASTALPSANAKKVKDRTAPMLSPSLRKLLEPVRPMIEPFRGTALFQEVRRRVVIEITYPDFPAALRGRLVAHYRPDVERLDQFIGRDLSHWTAPGDSHHKPLGVVDSPLTQNANQHSY